MALIPLTDEDLKCLQEHLKPLNQLLVKLEKGAVETAPFKFKKPESKKEGVKRMLSMIERKQIKKIK